ncbi:MAG: ATP synthase F1 subunit delta [Bacillota bacterium]|jgi:F-type H+-transporting ATPase subunit delta
MRNKALARRYGIALYQTAKEKHEEQRIFDELSLVINSIHENADFEKLIFGSIITAKEKKELIQKIYTDRVSPELVDFLCVCIDKGRERELEEIKTVYDDFWYEDEGIIPVYVSSAIMLDEKRQEALKKAFAKKLGQPVAIIVKVDESLIGGISARVGGTVYDGSISGHLARLSYQLHNSEVKES